MRAEFCFLQHVGHTKLLKSELSIKLLCLPTISFIRLSGNYHLHVELHFPVKSFDHNSYAVRSKKHNDLFIITLINHKIS